MSEQGEFADSDKSDFSQRLTPTIQTPMSSNEISFASMLSKSGFQPPRQLPKRSYSLQPDMATGWKPKKIGGSTLHNVFPINSSCQVVDYLIKQLYRRKNKQFEIVYLGPRKLNSYLLHENRKYENPYPIQKRLDPHLSERSHIPINPLIEEKNLKFNSNFECGNLDAAIFINPHEYDLFMRVDTNTKGHTNWYYFTVQNGNFIGSVRFNICNFNRQKSLYQRGLKPYYYSKRCSQSWKQGGQNVKYQKRTLRYHFLYQDDDYEQTLKRYITLSFTYHFDVPNDTIQFAYFIPYSYSRLLKFLSTVKNCKMLPPLKSLSGLAVPILEVTDEDVQEYNKKVVIVTARVHPGEANSSFICQGFIEHISSSQPNARQFRKHFIAYIIPMLNPDGVVAGNYRTSLFGKDLNRTFNSTRRYAFPQTFHLLQLVKDLKAKHKQRLNLFIDLHGHSVKKNVFMYGPQFNIQNPNYYIAKQLPRILGTLTPCFRFYSCSFRISSQKSTTARATLNRQISIPFTYTMESSNGFYYDSQLKRQIELNSKKLKRVGVALAEAMLIFRQIEGSKLAAYVQSSLGNHSTSRRDQQIQSLVNDEVKPQIGNKSIINHDHEILSSSELLKHTNNSQRFLSASSLMLDGEPQEYRGNQYHSDDDIPEGGSDSEPEDQDLSQAELERLLQNIQEGKDPIDPNASPQKHNSLHGILLGNFAPESEVLTKITKFESKSGKEKLRYKKKNPLLPPINCLNRAKEKNNKNFVQIKPEINPVFSPEKQKRSKIFSISQMVDNSRSNTGGVLAIIRKDEKYLTNSLLKKKTSKMQLERTKIFGSFYSNNKN